VSSSPGSGRAWHGCMCAPARRQWCHKPRRCHRRQSRVRGRRVRGCVRGRTTPSSRGSGSCPGSPAPAARWSASPGCCAPGVPGGWSGSAVGRAGRRPRRVSVRQWPRQVVLVSCRHSSLLSLACPLRAWSTSCGKLYVCAVIKKLSIIFFFHAPCLFATCRPSAFLTRKGSLSDFSST
jgi:hypothetical protein